MDFSSDNEDLLQIVSFFEGFFKGLLGKAFRLSNVVLGWCITAHDLVVDGGITAGRTLFEMIANFAMSRDVLRSAHPFDSGDLG